MPSTQGRGRLEPRSGRAAGASHTSRTALQRVLIGVNAVLVALVLVGASVSGYGWYRFQQIETVSIPDPIVPEGSDEPEDPEPTSLLDPGGARNYLLVGSDTREDQDARRFGTTDDSDTVNADTILLVRVDPKAQRVDIVSFLRDLWVTVYSPEGEALGKGRINTALGGGPDSQNGLIHTLGQNFGLPVHHFGRVSFRAFEDLVDAIGGVDVPFEHSVRDWDPDPDDPEQTEPYNPSGLQIAVDGPTCVTLDGETALDYVRSRHFQEWRNGRWVDDPTSDHGRTRRQRDLVRRAITQAIAEGRTSPSTVNQLFGITEDRGVSIDDDLSPRRLAAVANAFRSDEGDVVREHELRTTPFRTAGGAAVLRLVGGPANEAVLDVFRGVEPVDAPQPLGPPAPVTDAPPPTDDGGTPDVDPDDPC